MPKPRGDVEISSSSFYEMFGKKGSKILKLPPVRNCFTLAMTNKLVVIINSLKVPKIKKI